MIRYTVRIYAMEFISFSVTIRKLSYRSYSGESFVLGGSLIDL